MKKIIVIFITIIFTSSLVGCRKTRQEINKISVVLATGIDLTPDNKYLMTVQVLNSQKDESNSMGGSNSGGKQISSDVIVYSMEGYTFDDAISKISTEIGSGLFFHNKYVVIGKELAKSGMNLVIDSLSRAYDTRLASVLLITNGKASDIVKNTTDQDKIPANTVEKLIDLQGNYGYAPVIPRVKFINALYNKASSPIIGVINLRKNNGNVVFQLAGTAVFKRDKLSGFMDMYQTRGMQWIKGQVKSGEIITYLPDNNVVDFQIITSKSKMKSIIKDGVLTMKIDVTGESIINEMAGTLDPVKDYKVMDKFNYLQNEAIEQEVRLALYTAQKQFKLDILDFNGAIKRDNPDYWSKIEKNWDNIFPNIKVQVNVNFKVKRPGLISKPTI
ncbi:MAG: Ger(x)C family spore germination protein [Clostridium sp.]|nr:Ger(x)C family spore germination protein [Clostridium sp.]